MPFPPRAIRKPRIVFPPVDIHVVSEQIVLAMLNSVHPYAVDIERVMARVITVDLTQRQADPLRARKAGFLRVYPDVEELSPRGFMKRFVAEYRPAKHESKNPACTPTERDILAAYRVVKSPEKWLNMFHPDVAAEAFCEAMEKRYFPDVLNVFLTRHGVQYITPDGVSTPDRVCQFWREPTGTRGAATWATRPPACGTSRN